MHNLALEQWNKQMYLHPINLHEQLALMDDQ